MSRTLSGCAAADWTLRSYPQRTRSFDSVLEDHKKNRPWISTFRELARHRLVAMAIPGKTARVVAAISLACISFGAFGQTPENQPAFDAASVKLSGPRSARNFDGDAGRISYTCAHLQDILFRAWNLVDYQQISGPAWLGTESYDVVATFPPGTTKEQFRTMLQNLLAERFNLSLHHENRDFPVYRLVVEKNGPKLSRSMVLRPGFPQLPSDRPGMAMANEANCRLAARQEPLSVLANVLRGAAGRLIVDRTGLTGKYDFTLEFKGDGSPDDDPSASTLFEAVQEQLGLKLEAGKASFDVLVIDHARKVPTEN